MVIYHSIFRFILCLYQHTFLSWVLFLSQVIVCSIQDFDLAFPHCSGLEIMPYRHMVCFVLFLTVA